MGEMLLFALLACSVHLTSSESVVNLQQRVLDLEAEVAALKAQAASADVAAAVFSSDMGVLQQSSVGSATNAVPNAHTATFDSGTGAISFSPTW